MEFPEFDVDIDMEFLLRAADYLAISNIETYEQYGETIPWEFPW